jgi:transcriptional regulator of acetoin/glycerol metabolism
MTTVEHSPALAPLRQARERFLTGRPLPDGVPDEVLAAWRRARFFGVRHDLDGPLQDPEPPVESVLLEAARSVLERIAPALGGHSALLLTDERLRVVWTAGEVPGDDRCRDLSEPEVGHNSAALAVRTRRRAEVHGPEHFLDVWQDVSAVSVPLLAPDTGQALGTVTVASALCAGRGPHPGAALAEAAAVAVEAELLARSRTAERVLLDAYTRATHAPGRAVVALDGRNRLISEAAVRLATPQVLAALERASTNGVPPDTRPPQNPGRTTSGRQRHHAATAADGTGRNSAEERTYDAPASGDGERGSARERSCDTTTPDNTGHTATRARSYDATAPGDGERGSARERSCDTPAPDNAGHTAALAGSYDVTAPDDAGRGSARERSCDTTTPDDTGHTPTQGQLHDTTTPETTRHTAALARSYDATAPDDAERAPARERLHDTSAPGNAGAARERSYGVALPDDAGCTAIVTPVRHEGRVLGIVAVLEARAVPVPRPVPRPALALAGGSVPWRHAVGRAVELARVPEPLLLTGERGTGKTALARELLGETVPLVADAAESPELGVKYSELADGRPLLLRHAERLAQPDVAALNSLLDEHPDVHLLVTYTPGTPPGPCFQRLLDTLAARSVALPALRERREDVRELLPALAPRPAPGQPPLSWTLDALRALEEHPWPGNVTELAHVVRALAEHRRITGPVRRAELPDPVREGPAARRLSPMEHAERAAILAALRRHGGNKARAAAALGIGRATLYRKLRGYQGVS